ncbi:MAG: response regulator [Gemmatimonadota bacterium]|nr:response regulator [Gemmatimonadota bacterium]
MIETDTGVATDAAPAVRSAAPRSALRCLVVDDEPRLRQALVRLMQSDGFICSEAGSGVEALQVIEREPGVTLILSDMRMPFMDGAELLRNVRHRYPDIAVVMITAVADVQVAVECIGMGAMDYLTKPFVLEEVRVRVAQVLEKRRLILENREYQQHLEDKVGVQAQRLEDLFLASVQSLAEALELKDPYTRGHSERVSRYMLVIARTLGLGGEVTRQIELGGHLHDIGKIGVRETVLNKEGPLTAEEYEHIMTHPLLGWRILRPLLADAPTALDIVRSHHERMDGRGVPDRLTGTLIPQAARICAVADAFDAMMSIRSYRTTMSIEDALAELRCHAGTQFDADVVDAFLAAFERGEIEASMRQPLLAAAELG